MQDPTSTTTVDTDWVTKMMDQLVLFGTDYGLKIVGAIAILIVGRIAAAIARRIVRALLEKSKTDKSINTFVGSLTYAAVMTFAVIAAMASAGIQTTSFVAVLGAAGFAVGFALQGSLSNFAAGVMILMLRPFKVGDYIEGGDAKGTVKAIELFTTELATLDNIRVIVPNGKLFGDNIRNLSGYARRRVDISVGISYGASMRDAIALLERAIAEDPRVLSEPAPSVVVAGLGDSSVDLLVLPWVDPKDYWPVFFELTRKVKETLDENGIEIPFPQRVLHLESAEGWPETVGA